MQEEIRVIVIDDEELWLKNLTTSLNNFGYTVAGTADSFESAVALLSSAEYDIVLLDISLKLNIKKSGIELGQLISKHYHKPYIFITGSNYSHNLKEAIDSGPSAYLYKPVNPASLIATIQIALSNFTKDTTSVETHKEPESDIFFVKQGARYKKIKWDEIVYLRSEVNNTVLFNSPDKVEYNIRSSLSNTMKYIIPHHLQSSFVQVNRAEAVNISFITEMAGEEIRTSNKVFTLTEAYRSGLKKAIHLIS